MLKKVILFASLCLGTLTIFSGANAEIPASFAVGLEPKAAGCEPSAGREPGSPVLVSSDPSEKDFGNPEEEDLDRAFEDLIKELKRLEKDVKDKVRKELLPHLKREIERLRKWLREFNLDGEPQEPVKT